MASAPRQPSPSDPAPDPLATAARVVVVDLEATTSEDGSLPREERETIEIGAVLVRLDDLALEAEHQGFVRPVRHPALDPFCTRLTGIAQAQVDAAPHFPVAFAAFVSALVERRGPGLVWASWGSFDRRQLEQDCAFHGVPCPLPAHVNLKERFSARLGIRRRLSVGEALARCDLAFEGSPHRGLDDARNIARLLPWVLGRR